MKHSGTIKTLGKTLAKVIRNLQRRDLSSDAEICIRHEFVFSHFASFLISDMITTIDLLVSYSAFPWQPHCVSPAVQSEIMKLES